jgi:hypothetical protein
VPEDTQWISKKRVVIPVPRECIDYAEVGDTIHFTDARGKKRKFDVIRKSEKGLRLVSYKTAYIATGTKLRVRRKETRRFSFESVSCRQLWNPSYFTKVIR